MPRSSSNTPLDRIRASKHLKVNFWTAHMGVATIEGHVARSRLFLQSFDDFRGGRGFSKDLPRPQNHRKTIEQQWKTA